MRIGFTILAASAVLLVSGCDGASVCDPAGLQAALDAAEAGDVVTLGSCTVHGSFRVPAGAVVEGAADGTSVLEGDVLLGNVVVRLDPGTPETTLRNVRIDSSLTVALLARGAGAIRVEDVEVHVASGFGVVLVGLDRATVSGLDVIGPVPVGSAGTEDVFTYVDAVVPAEITPSDEASCGAPLTCTPGEERDTDGPSGSVHQYCSSCGRWTSVTGTEGIVAIDDADLSLADVGVSGMTRHAVLVSGGAAFRWMNGDVTRNIGVGVIVAGVQAELDGVTISDTLTGFRAEPSVALYTGTATAATSVITDSLTVSGSSGYGVIHSNTAVTHTGLDVSGNDRAGMWVGACPSFSLIGSTIRDNRFAGVVVVSSSDVTISGTTIAGTVEAMGTLGGGGGFEDVEMGDGLQLFDSLERISLSDLTLENNGRVGLLLDVGEGSPGDHDICMGGAGVCFDNVSVQSASGVPGALAAQQRTALAGFSTVYEGTPMGAEGAWDMGITRAGGALGDAAFVTPMTIAGVIGPIDTPPFDGVRGVIGPID